MVVPNNYKINHIYLFFVFNKNLTLATYCQKNYLRIIKTNEKKNIKKFFFPNYQTSVVTVLFPEPVQMVQNNSNFEDY